MKLRIESTNPSNKSYLDFTRVTAFEVTKDYASITFETADIAAEAYNWIWNGGLDPELFKDLAHNASLYAFKKEIGFTNLFDYVFKIVE